MNKAQLRDILKADAARRAQRKALEDAILGITNEPDECSDAFKIAHAKPHSVANGCLVRPIGVVSSHNVRYSERWTGTLGTEPHKSGRTIGTADGLTNSVKVTRNGHTEIVSAASFKGKRSTTTKRAQSTTAQIPEAARIKLQHDFNA